MPRLAVTIRAGEEQKARWSAAAHGERLSLSAWMRRVLDQRATEQVGRGGTARAGEPAAARLDPPAESLAAAPEPEAPTAAEPPAPLPPERAAAVVEALEEAVIPAPTELPARGPGVLPEREFRPDPKQPKKRGASLGQVLGESKGTVSSTQSLKAIEAARQAQRREDAFSLTCPNRAKHTVGARCPLCHGIQ